MRVKIVLKSILVEVVVMPESKGSKAQLLEKLSGKVSSAANSGSNQFRGKNSDITEEKINTSEEQKTEVNDLPDLSLIHI